MRTTRERECLHCGMINIVNHSSIWDRALVEPCNKCDSSLFEQGDGSVLHVDIAHNRETVDQALGKLEQALERCWRGFANRLRLVVGGGRIHDAVLGQLEYLRNQDIVLDYREENRNPGAVLVTVR